MPAGRAVVYCMRHPAHETTCACAQVLLSLGVSRQFRTLRDHEGAEIKKKDLELLGMLGQGERGVPAGPSYGESYRSVVGVRAHCHLHEAGWEGPTMHDCARYDRKRGYHYFQVSFASERASDTVIDFCAGAFAIVEKCTYLPQNRIVAVKRLRPDVMKNSEDVKVSEPVVATCQCKSVRLHL